MNAPQRTIVGGMLIASIAGLAMAFVAHAQTQRPTLATPGITTTTTPAAAAPAATARPAHPVMNAEQEAVWNSPNMLRARAWLQEYCATSKNCKPGDYEKYAAELENLSATQMKLWLMKFDEEEDQKQQRAFYQQAQSAVLKQAKAADKATQQSYAAIEKEESASANEEESQIQEQEQNEQTMLDDKQLGPYTRYGQGLYPGVGDGVHYHFHLYPQ